MHSLFEQASQLTHDAIGGAIEVHKDKGPGLLEPIYEWCLSKEYGLRGCSVRSQGPGQIEYKGFFREHNLRFDLLLNECLLVEAKAVEKTSRFTKRS